MKAAVERFLVTLGSAWVIGFLFVSCGPSQPATVGTAQAELESVLGMWKAGDYKLNPSARRKELRGFFESMMANEVLESFTVNSGEATEKAGEFRFSTTLICRPIMGSVINPAANAPREVERGYYVYRPKGKWVIESAELRAFQESIFGE